jgi:hypothetical protein
LDNKFVISSNCSYLDPQIKVTGDGDDKVKELMRQSVSPVVKKMISAFLKEMKESKSLAASTRSYPL